MEIIMILMVSKTLEVSFDPSPLTLTWIWPPRNWKLNGFETTFWIYKLYVSGHMGFIYMLNLALKSDSDSVCFQPAKDLKVQTSGVSFFNRRERFDARLLNNIGYGRLCAIYSIPVSVFQAVFELLLTIWGDLISYPYIILWRSQTVLILISTKITVVNWTESWCTQLKK